tara:strand:+ start:33 stop:248 length:216 start_codon:yes stop_codon:yes gene_type:complete
VVVLAVAVAVIMVRVVQLHLLDKVMLVVMEVDHILLVLAVVVLVRLVLTHQGKILRVSVVLDFPLPLTDRL